MDRGIQGLKSRGLHTHQCGEIETFALGLSHRLFQPGRFTQSHKDQFKAFRAIACALNVSGAFGIDGLVGVIQ